LQDKLIWQSTSRLSRTAVWQFSTTLLQKNEQFIWRFKHMLHNAATWQPSYVCTQTKVLRSMLVYLATVLVFKQPMTERPSFDKVNDFDSPHGSRK